MLQKFLITSLLTSVIATSAAAGDLPSRTTAPLPPQRPVVTSDAGFYAGVRGGVVFNDNITAGVGAGYQFNQFVRSEINYDYLNNDNNRTNGLTSNIGTVNMIGQYQVAAFTPYALAGIGYRWSDAKNEGVWNVGAGVRYNVVENVELDARYRYISSFQNERAGNLFTLGLNYKF